MIKKILSMIFTDLHWKLLALGAAFVLWVLGMNIHNPMQNDAVTPRLQFYNIDILTREQVVVLNEEILRETPVRVGLRANRQDMDLLRSAIPMVDLFDEMVSISVDFRAVDTESVRNHEGVSTQRLFISPNLYQGFEHTSISPAYVEVQLDTRAQELVNVDVVYEGEVAPNLELQPIELTNSRVNVAGARSIIRTVSAVRVYVDISGIHSQSEETVGLRVYDNEGNNITELVQLSVRETTASVRVWPVRQIPIVVETTGDLAPGFAVAENRLQRDVVEVVGPPEIIEALEYIEVEVAVDGISNDIIDTIYLADWLPDGVRISRGELPFNMVSVNIEPIQSRIFSVPLDNVRTRGVAVQYLILGDDLIVSVNVSGPRSLIAALNVNSIRLELDLRRLSIGSHTVPLEVDLPVGLYLTANPPSLRVQIQEPAELDAGNEAATAPIIIPPPEPDPPETTEPYDVNGGDEQAEIASNPDYYTDEEHNDEYEYYELSDEYGSYYSEDE